MWFAVVLVRLITSFPLWIPKIVAGFAAAGEAAVGAQGTINPSDVIDLGITLAGKLLSSFDVVGILRDPVYGDLRGDLRSRCAVRLRDHRGTARVGARRELHRALRWGDVPQVRDVPGDRGSPRVI
jgi:hypothetical protein